MKDRRGEMQGLKIGPLWESRMIAKAMGLTRDVLIRVEMFVAALNSRQEDVHEEKRSRMRRGSWILSLQMRSWLH
jgi:hypothetical protein